MSANLERSYGRLPRVFFDSIGDSGIVVPIEIDLLVDNIFISPDSQTMLLEIVIGLAKTHGLKAAVHRSNVDNLPDY